MERCEGGMLVGGGGHGGEVGCLVEEIKGSAAVTWFTFRQRQRYRRHTTTADREAHVVTLFFSDKANSSEIGRQHTIHPQQQKNRHIIKI
jgi:hypothetical protein